MSPNLFFQKKGPGTLILFFAVTVLCMLLSACNENKVRSNTSFVSQSSAYSCDSNWVVLDVKFKTNVNKATRDGAAQVIGQYLIDTVTTIRSGGYPNYKPSLSIKTFAFQDTLLYQFKVSGRTDYGGYAATDTTSGPTPPCKCPSCGVCPKVQSLIFNGDPLSTIVDTVTTQ